MYQTVAAPCQGCIRLKLYGEGFATQAAPSQHQRHQGGAAVTIDEM
jgi:hypothetical protein